ncbi:hypothetical protein [Aeromicrobium sp. IC_218]|uniref:hypothetical protein n=1 Tax=Aeromicrobium sp. IC_218 TaxID=2545468 RepID=UPI00103FEA08|nr:hypothetical protein [Aeromicrobium sp. IC_218]TCI96408.1 hypothetical protein E0W78_14845 [Aeromicrobium sp. IC_218]
MQSAQEAAAEALDLFRADLTRIGAIEPIRDLVGDVWSQNIDRHEPDVAGDTALSLGQNCVENLKTLALRRYRRDEREAVEDHWQIPGLQVELIKNALTLTHGNRRILLMKVPPNLGRRPSFSQFPRWASQSDVRHEMAVANTYALNGIRSDDLDQLTFADDPYDPTLVRNFLLVWAGEEDSPKTGAHLTVPVMGIRPFAAQVELWHDDDEKGRVRSNADMPEGPRFDTQPAVEPAIAIKPRPASEGNA